MLTISTTITRWQHLYQTGFQFSRNDMNLFRTFEYFYEFLGEEEDRERKEEEEEGMKVIALNRIGSIKRKSMLTQVKDLS